MKILHSKATSDPILLVSVCHNMNLFAVVTRSAATVYRATTLTVIASHSLKQEPCSQLLPLHDGGDAPLRASWSPSGRIFTLALPSGVVLLIDVEESMLVRRLLPRSLHHSGANMNEEDESCRHGADARDEHPDEVNSGDEYDDEEEEDEDEARKLSCDQALRAPPAILLSTAATHVACLSWITVPSTAHGALVRGCLPLRPTISSSLLEEVESQPQQQTSSVPERQVTFLVVVDAEGGTSIVVGGMHEVLSTRLADVSSGRSPCDGAVAEQFQISSYHHHHAEHSALAPLTDGLTFQTLTAANLLAVAAALRSNKSSTGAASISGKEARHHAYMAARDISGPSATAQRLVEIDLGGYLGRLAARDAPTLCRVTEYCRIAGACLRNAKRRWGEFIHGRTRRHLRLPECAALMRDAVVEAVAVPDNMALERYYADLDRPLLARDLDKISLVLSALANDVYNVCYRAYDLALALVSGLRGGGGGGRQLHSGTAPAAGAGPMYGALCGLLAEHRRHCEGFLSRMRAEGSAERDLLHFVLQRSSLLFDDMPDEVDDLGNPTGAIPFSYAAEPLPVTAQPALLANLQAMARGDADTEKEREDSDFDRRERQIELGIKQGLHLSSASEGDEGDGACLRCAVVPLGDGAGPHTWRLDLGDASSPPAPGGGEAVGGIPAVAVHAVRAAASSPFTIELLSSPFKLRPRGPCSAASEAAAIPSEAVPQGELCPMELNANDSVSALLPSAAPVVAWYGYLEDNRHLLLLLARDDGGGGGPTDGFSLAMVDNEGNVKAREKDDDDESDGDADEGGSAQDGSSDSAAVAADACAEFMITEVKGMEVEPQSLKVSMSRARQLCVVAAKNRFVVIDLFDE